MFYFVFFGNMKQHNYSILLGRFHVLMIMHAICCILKTSHLCINYTNILFTFIVLKIHIFFLRISQKCTTFALAFDNDETNNSVTYNLTMKMNITNIKQQTQDFVLRLFVESSDGIYSQHYICSHVGTHARLHQ